MEVSEKFLKLLSNVIERGNGYLLFIYYYLLFIYLFFTSCILLALSEDYSVRVVFHSPGIKSPAQVKLGQDKMKTFLNEMVSSVVS